MAGSGRVGSSRIWVLNMNTNFFCSVDYVHKINSKRDMRCCDLPYVTAEGGSQLRETLRFAQRRSQLMS